MHQPIDYVGLSTLIATFAAAVTSIIAALRANAAAKNTTTSNGANLATTVEQIHANTSAIRTRSTDPAAPVIITKTTTPPPTPPQEGGDTK